MMQVEVRWERRYNVHRGTLQVEVRSYSDWLRVIGIAKALVIKYAYKVVMIGVGRRKTGVMISVGRRKVDGDECSQRRWDKPGLNIYLHSIGERIITRLPPPFLDRINLYLS